MIRTSKKWIKYCLPPVVVDLARRRPKPPNGPPEWEYLPEGWREREDDGQGWNVDSVVDAQRQKWQRFAELAQGAGPLGIAHEAAVPHNRDFGAHATIMSFGYVVAQAARHADSLSMLDWGGGVGHYGILARALLPRVEVDYHCKDVPLLCAAGRSLQPDFMFHEDEASCFARRYDLVMASGSIHYSRDWRASFEALAAAARGWLYITRLPMVENSPSFVVLQRPYMHGYDTEYYGWFINRMELLDHAKTLGLEVVREFLVPEAPHVANAPEPCQYGGFLFRPTLSPLNS